MFKPTAKNLETGSTKRFKVLHNGALNQNRTGDLILTMDALCRLSYEGIYNSRGAGDGNRTHAVSLGS